MTDEPLRRIFATLNELGAQFMLTGSYASNLYGKVRSTFDADVVIVLDAKTMGAIVGALKGDFFFDSESLAEVQEAGGQFNAIHKTSGLKIDFYLVASTDYARRAFSRRKPHRVFGLEIPVISPEDLILAKLDWAKQGGSGRQLEDARGVLELQRNTLDIAYLKKWAAVLSVSDKLSAIGVV